MTTYFRTKVKVGFGSKEHDTGYPGLICKIPELEIPKGEEFSVEYMYNNMCILKYNLHYLPVEIFTIGKFLLEGDITQIDAPRVDW
ncbi:MAG: hypothetical protein QG644_287 [Patescibacteria group bacterium]|nr:hypothetical protein [Candidatus Paceibacterota bacterium]MDQ5922579.1 hypothetical protein [Patescibacteria group bacterium]